MESIVVTLETAKKLKAAGFPQTSQFFWRNYGEAEPADGGGEVWDIEWEPYDENCIAAPTGQELADQLPEDFNLGRVPDTYAEGSPEWSALYQEGGIDEIVEDHEGLGHNMAEALAALWLNLQEVQG